MGKKLVKFHEHYKMGSQLVTPLNMFFKNIELMEWHHDRLPEYLWLGLILHRYGRKEGLKYIQLIIDFIINNINPIPFDISFTEILSISNEQHKLYKYIINDLKIGEALEPLTIFVDITKYYLFIEHFTNSKTVDEKLEIIHQVMENNYFHQSNTATDIRYCIVKYMFDTGKLKLSNIETISVIKDYPLHNHDEEIMKLYRPLIRSSEGSLFSITKHFFYKTFWERCSEIYSCKPLVFKTKGDNNMEEANNDLAKIKNILVYLDNLMRLNYKDNKKVLVLFGLFSFSVRRFDELVRHNLFCETTGRNILRSLIESYINSKYMLKIDNDDNSIWDNYIDKGLGTYKKTFEVQKDYSDANNHINNNFIKFLIEDNKSLELTNIEIGYVLKSMREMCDDVDEKYLYSLYDFDSNIEHALWGAIAETALYKCLEVCHELHWCLSTGELNTLPSVYNDCLLVLKKHILLLKNLYDIPDDLLL